MQHNSSKTLDEPSLAVLYQRFAPVLFAHLYRHTSSREDAEDLLLEVFMAALESAGFAILNAQEQENWLWSVTRNKTVDHYRRHARRPKLGLDLVVDSLYERDEYAPEHVTLRREEYAHLRANIAQLPEIQQEVLRLRFANDLHCSEIATVLQKSEGAIRMLLSRTLKLLRTLYRKRREEKTMHGKEDFFSPKQVDEQLELSLLQRNPGVRDQKSDAADPNLLLVDDLRFLYDAEGTENARSLQRVWERIGEQRVSRQAPAPPLAPEYRPQLRLLKSNGQATPASAKKRKRRGAPSRVLTVLAAMLFLVIMVGSLLEIVHLTRQTQTGPNVASSTATTQAGQWTPVPGYPYPTPGSTTSISPASPDGFSSLTFSPDGQQVAASTQGKVWIWGTHSSVQPFIYDPQAGSAPVTLAWSPVAPLLAVGTSEVQVIDPGNGVVQFTDPALASDPAGNNAARVTALAWSPDGKRLAVAAHDPIVGNEVSIWDTDGNLLYTFTGQRAGNAINSLSWSSDGRYVASANGQSVQAWDTHTPGSTPIFQHAISAATDVAWSPGSASGDAGNLAFVSNGGTQVWYVWTDSLVSSYPNTPNGALSWSPNGNYLATASGRNVIIYNATTGVHLYTYGGNTHDVCALAWSPDGNSIASGENSPGSPNYVRVWSA